MRKTVVFTIYARYSSDLQNPRSCQDQISLILQDVQRRFPDWIHCTQYPHFTDEAETGRSVAHRPGFQEMIRIATSPNCPFNVILVEDLSRFARNREESIHYRRMLRDHGVRVLSVADGYVDEEDESGLWLLGIKEIKAEADSREIGRRTKRGMIAKAQEGYWCGGRPPFGYRRKPIYDPQRKDIDGNPLRIGVRLEIEPKEAEIVRKIYEMYVHAGFGLRRIARILNSRGIRKRDRFGDPGGTFAPTVVRSMLKNPIYKGLLVWNRTKDILTHDGRRLKRPLPQEEWVVCKMPELAIVSEELWEAAQRRLEENKKLSKGVGKGTNKGVGRPRMTSFLRGLVECAECGAKFVVRGSRGGSHYRYFVCGKRIQRGEAVCSNKTSIRVERLEQVVLEMLKEKVYEPEAFRYLVYRTAKEVERRFKQRLGNLRKLMRKKRAIEAKIGRLVDAIESGVGIEELRERLARRKQEKEELEAQIKMMQEENIEEKYAQTVLDAVWRLFDVLNEKPPEMLHGELRRHIEAIRVYGDGRVELVTSLEGVFEGSVFGLELRKIRIGAAGFEPATSSPPCWRANQTALRPAQKMGPGGFEPPTSRLSGVRSTH